MRSDETGLQVALGVSGEHRVRTEGGVLERANVMHQGSLPSVLAVRGTEGAGPSVTVVLVSGADRV